MPVVCRNGRQSGVLGTLFVVALCILAAWGGPLRKTSAWAGTWEESRIRTARELLAAGFLRSSYTMYANILSRSTNPAVRSQSLEVMAAIAWKLGKDGHARELLDKADMERGVSGSPRTGAYEGGVRQHYEGVNAGGDIRVLLARNAVLNVRFVGPCVDSGAIVLPRGEYEVSAKHGHIYFGGRSAGTMLQCAPSDGVFEYGGRVYPGAVRLMVDNDSALLVNLVPLETYLRGVVPAEMPASWNGNALKAQAVAARTYAARRMRHPRHAEYDLVDDERDQVYTGFSACTPESDLAVSETAGRILTHGGEPILAMYHAHSGGRLEAASLDSHPYLQGGQDVESTSMWSGAWEMRLPVRRLARHIGRDVLGITAPERTPGGRIESFHVRTDTGMQALPCRDVSALLAPERLPSRLCDVRLEGDEVVLSGTGYGHGMGMSQWGARAMAEKGRSYVAILNRYFPGAELLQAGQ
ncbi:hypothetical protein DPQ33_11045 [Oceanidesulfovibrio indonesiensis]|uniref:Sporulation stage II protein D amidase enhancer LytB N-terminal domain-containing protein n=1 Tax=Oceanidesulfovibrio indonesiensis TaxID=54767 RepID=A0A7M3MDY5_9BACT|nr:hypothetical protein DPQ33_11045 [Oceanidesulfovibrio indonesiensis]